MPLPKINPTKTDSWEKLKLHFEQLKDVKMQDLFSSETLRNENFRINWEDFDVDFSKNRITSETLNLLYNLAKECELTSAINAQFAGEHINETEDRAVHHTALRDFENLKPEVATTLKQMKRFSSEVISGEWKGYTGKAISTIVNIGIGGSDLGPAMATEALKFYQNHLEVIYISNVDGDHVMETLKPLDIETTLFIIVSKTFTTQETLSNATTIRKIFLKDASETDIAQHFVAVSTNLDAVKAFGISAENTFTLWDWVGGRFSLWSAVGLSTCCAVGYDNFKELLEGANEMDVHFKETPFTKNIPVTLALISIWYNNFFNSETEAVLPYSQYLSKYIDYLQQAVMESNGKSVDRNGDFIEYQTGTIVWGSTGTNVQHAFMQLIHQGTKLIPCDFICYTESLHKLKDHQQKLLANCYAQTEALMQGTYGEIVKNNFKNFDGNKPSNLIEIKKLTPKSLGKLIALYEHKLFVQGIIWNIFSYDQWGVELGKKLAVKRLQ
ncbi:glucose-6-phosphate isomerase [Patiriisocius marinus]|uniref:glucose-6-phosphate isomerase n=1 Tax=Patiriisocius marinus TaxID=1397112 RepID=UPI0023306685|nr:glucose-6-phosphate isomerase [Patiriisocius marinus]